MKIFELIEELQQHEDKPDVLCIDNLQKEIFVVI